MERTKDQTAISRTELLAFLSLSPVLYYHLYILKHFPFSIAYPLSCLSFVFGMLGAWCFLGESIPLIRWVGIALILLGAVFIAK